MASVHLDNVRKVFDNGFEAVKGATFDIPDGEFIVLVGPSGCGKSTTLRMVAGLETVSEGEIRIGDRIVNEVAPKDRDIAMVFQNYALYPHMTVFDNLAFGLKLRKYAKNEIRERVEQAATTLGISEILERKPKQLSGGQRQRVAVGRAIVRKPQVFLFDEPLSNLDAKLRVQMRTEISKLHQKLGATMIYVTHDQVEAMTMGDRIVVMKDGEIHQIDTPLNLYNNPTNRFVAGFIGSPSMNFIEGTIEVSAGRSFVSNDKQLSLPLDDKRSLLAGPIVLGIRPENIYLDRPDHGDEIKAAGELFLDVVEPMGNEIVLYASYESGVLVGRISPQPLPETGDRIRLAFDTESLHFFHAETGETIAR